MNNFGSLQIPSTNQWVAVLILSCSSSTHSLASLYPGAVSHIDELLPPPACCIASEGDAAKDQPRRHPHRHSQGRRAVLMPVMRNGDGWGIGQERRGGRRRHDCGKLQQTAESTNGTHLLQKPFLIFQPPGRTSRFLWITHGTMQPTNRMRGAPFLQEAFQTSPHTLSFRPSDQLDASRRPTIYRMHFASSCASS